MSADQERDAAAERAFEAWWEPWIRRQYPFFNNETLHGSVTAPLKENVREAWHAALASIQKEREAAEALREALNDYGRHDKGCSADVDEKYRCTCFWTQTRQRLGLQEPS